MLSQMKRSINDSITLLNIFINKRLYKQTTSKPSSIQDMLLQEANEKNTVALFALRVKKEYNLMKYKGMRIYLQDNNMNLNVMEYIRGILYGSSKYKLDTMKHSTSTDDTNKAKVAFMITSTQKQELETLGYEESEVKKLKPLEAALILQNKITPENIHTVEKRVQDYHHKEALRNEKKNEDFWYEVVQSMETANSATKTESIISLYRTEEEAMVCLDIKQQAADRERLSYRDDELIFKYYIRKRT